MAKKQHRRTQYLVILPAHKEAWGKAIADLAEGVQLMHEMLGQTLTEYAVWRDGEILPLKMFAGGDRSTARRPVNERASFYAFTPPENDLHGTAVLFADADGMIAPLDFDQMCAAVRMVNEET